MTAKQYSSDQVCNSDVALAFVSKHTSKDGRRKAYGTAGRVVSGLLKAAAKRGEIQVSRTSGRVTGDHVYYTLTDVQVEAFRAEAIKRAA